MKMLIYGLIVVSLITVLLSANIEACTDPEINEARKKFLKHVREEGKFCSEIELWGWCDRCSWVLGHVKQICLGCNGNGEVLDWDSIKTAFAKDTPETERKYNECQKCEGRGWIVRER